MSSGIPDERFTSSADSQDGAARERDGAGAFRDFEISGIVGWTAASSRANAVHSVVSRSAVAFVGGGIADLGWRGARSSAVVWDAL